jgi:Domain of unknown function (DUF4153)
VLALGELPKNLLSPLILFAGLFGLLLALALEPLAHDAGERAVGWMMRAFPALLLPLVPLAIRAVWVRQLQHGWTELRYLRLALLLALLGLAVAGTVRLVRRRPPLLAAVPATLCLVLLACAAGPWSAPAVSRRDQLGRLRHALAGAGLLVNGRLTGLPFTEAERRHVRAGRQVAAAAFDEITGTARYLMDEHGPESLEALIPQAPRFTSSYALVDALPITRGCEVQARVEVSAQLPPGTAVPGLAGGTAAEFRTVFSVDSSTPGLLVAQARGSEIQLWRTGHPDRLRIDLAPLVARLGAQRAECPGGAGDTSVASALGMADTPLTPAEALRPVADASGRPVGQAVLTRVEVTDSAPAAPRMADAVGWLVVRP